MVHRVLVLQGMPPAPTIPVAGYRTLHRVRAPAAVLTPAAGAQATRGRRPPGHGCRNVSGQWLLYQISSSLLTRPQIDHEGLPSVVAKLFITKSIRSRSSLGSGRLPIFCCIHGM